MMMMCCGEKGVKVKETKLCYDDNDMLCCCLTGKFGC